MNAIKLFGVLFIVFLISMYQSCTELKLSIAGMKATGKVEDIFVELEGGTKSETGRYKIVYSYVAEENGRKNSFNGEYYTDKKEAVKKLVGEEVQVLYQKSKPEIHRVVGHRGIIWVVIFMVMFVIIAINALFIWKQAQNDLKESRR